jgi:hypothetical protein
MTLRQTHNDDLSNRTMPRGNGARRKAMIVLIYTAIGPALGGLLMVSALYAVSALESGVETGPTIAQSPLQYLIYLPLVGLTGALFGFYFGGVQAFACGVLLAAMSDLNGKFSYVQAAIAAVLVAFLSAALVFVASDGGLSAAAFMVVAGPPTSLLLRFLFRKRFAPVKAPS